MMKTRRLMISLILVFASMNLFADVLLSPAMGMMKEHPMVPSGREYTDFAKPTPTYTERPADLYDFVAVAICSSPKYNHGAFGSGPYVVEESISFEVSSFEGMFVSDENPVYKRPFDLYYIERGVRRNESSDSSRTEIRGYGKIEAGEEYIFPELGDWGDRYYRWVWRDIIIQLPGTATSGGVEVDGTYYPLIQGTYTATFDIKMTVNRGEPDEESTSMTVVIPGYYSVDFSTPSDTTAALSIIPYAASANLNLTTMLANKNYSVDIGSMDFLIRLADSSSGQLDDGAEAFSIFLSASPDPSVSDIDGFKLVHQDFKDGIDFYTDTNNLDYFVTITGDSDHSGIAENFYGEDSFDENSGPTKSISTQCHKVWSDHNNAYAHYHTFNGLISVQLEDRVSQLPPAEGWYSDYIYVHVISERT